MPSGTVKAVGRDSTLTERMEKFKNALILYIK